MNRQQRERPLRAGRTVADLAVILVLLSGCAPAEVPDAAWFGLELPPGLGDPHHPVVRVADVVPAPLSVPAGEKDNHDLEGVRILADVDTITGFSRQDRAAGNRMWGRVTGRPSAAATMEWVGDQFQDAGLQDVEVQAYDGTEDMWWPRTWEVRLVADPAFGAGSQDVVLESALPTSGSEIPGLTLAAALVDVGRTSDETLADVDVRGKVAVQHLRPASGAYSERRQTVARARALMSQGAVAVLNVVEQTGNMHLRDFSNCDGPCFNIGTADGAFLDAVMARAAETGASDTLRLELSLETEMLAGLTGHNVVGVVPGASDENIIVNAHADGWFDAAGDNADGLAVLLAMARHFARPEHQLDRTLVFVASGGHHSRGLNGPTNFVTMNPALTEKTVLVLNLEHIAQLAIQSGAWTVDSTEQRMSFGIDNEDPLLIDAGQRGMARYGFQLNPEFRASVPGDLGGYRPLGVPRVQAIHSGPMYHASGDVLETISVPGLERAARFYAFFVREVAMASRDDLGRGPE